MRGGLVTRSTRLAGLLAAALLGAATQRVSEPQLVDRLDYASGHDPQRFLFAAAHAVMETANASAVSPTWEGVMDWLQDGCENDTIASWMQCPDERPENSFSVRTRLNLSRSGGGELGSVLRSYCSPGSEAQAYNRVVYSLVGIDVPIFLSNCSYGNVALEDMHLAVAPNTRKVFIASSVPHYVGYHRLEPFGQVRRWSFDVGGRLTGTRPWRSMIYAASLCCTSR